MAAIADATNAEILKIVYAKTETMAANPDALLQKMYPFDAMKANGTSYNVPVQLTFEQGYTLGGQTTAAVPYDSAVVAETRQAAVTACQLHMNTELSYAYISRASQAGPKAVVSAFTRSVLALKRGMERINEIEMLYGGEGINSIASGPLAGVLSGASVVIDADSWTPGFWTSANGMRIEIRDVTGAILRNSTDLVVDSVDAAAKTLLVSGTTTTDIVATDRVWLKNGFDNGCTGLSLIAGNTGTLFGIPGATFDKWRGNTFDVGGPLTITSLLKGLVESRDRGDLSGDLDIFVPTSAWTDLQDEAQALARLDQRYTPNTQEFGSRSFTLNTGYASAQIHAHRYIRQSEAYAVPKDHFWRIGSSDISNKVPGLNEELSFNNPATSSYVVRLFSDQAPFTDAVSQFTRFVNIDTPTP